MKLIGIIVGIIILGGIVWFAFGRSTDEAPEVSQTVLQSSPTPTAPGTAPATQSTPTTTQASASQNATVTYDGRSFSPSPLTVAAGTTVAFVNKSNSSMWVAADPHPTHTTFSALDAQRGYNSGQTYSFTFTQPGTYKYHDHLNPLRGGTIVVQ